MAGVPDANELHDLLHRAYPDHVFLVGTRDAGRTPTPECVRQMEHLLTRFLAGIGVGLTCRLVGPDDEAAAARRRVWAQAPVEVRA